jgi:hypothetical protein
MFMKQRIDRSALAEFTQALHFARKTVAASLSRPSVINSTIAPARAGGATSGG